MINGIPTPLVEAAHLHYSYGAMEVLADVSLCIQPGERFIILGPNGSGKSTLIKILARLLRPRGSLRFRGRSLSRVSRKKYAAATGYAPQGSDFTGFFTVEQFVAMGRYPHLSLFSSLTETDVDAVNEAMEATGVTHLARRSMDELSGGERQRAIIAGALSQNPALLLLDEPTAFLDPKHQTEVISLLMRLNREKQIAIVMVTHDINQAALFGQTIIGLREGRQVFSGTPEELMTQETLKSIYEKEFIIAEHPLGGGLMVAPERAG